MTHFENLLFYIPDLKKRHILDVGAGKGQFIIEGANLGVNIFGIEYNPNNIIRAKEKAKELGLNIEIVQGEAEHLPFQDKSFNFLNFAEVIEHVRSPEETLVEAYRVLSNGGSAYISVPSRYSWFDPHFKIAFVNWLPRNWSDFYISFFKKHKNYNGESGQQRLSEMHYYKFDEFVNFVKSVGFVVEDMRMLKIHMNFKNPLARQFVSTVYRFVKPWYFRAFHFKLTKM